MKTKFNALLSFFRGIQDRKIIFSWYVVENDIDFDSVTCNIQNIPNMFLDYTSEILEFIYDDIYNELENCYSDLEQHRIDLILEPNKNSMQLYLYYLESIDSDETDSSIIEDVGLVDIFNRFDIKTIECDYNGNGDDGYLGDFTATNNDSDITSELNNREKQHIEDILYESLERAFIGWEIDDGSYGKIEIDKDLKLSITHHWRITEFVLCDDDGFTITNETFDKDER